MTYGHVFQLIFRCTEQPKKIELEIKSVYAVNLKKRLHMQAQIEDVDMNSVLLILMNFWEYLAQFDNFILKEQRQTDY